MKICLINPLATQTEDEHPASKNEHLGLGYIAALLESHNFCVNVIESAHHDKKGIKLIDQIIEERYEVIGVSISHYNYLDAIRIIRRLRAKEPSLYLFVGGYYPTLHFTELFQMASGINCCIIGEGEYTCLELIQALKEGRDWSLIEGIVYQKGSEIVQTNRRSLPQNLDNLPFPKRSDFIRDQSASMITTRGCYENCIFCSNKEFLKSSSGKKFRFRTAENVVSEMELLVNDYGIRHIFFMDNNLLLGIPDRKGWLHKFCKCIKDRNLKVKFSSYTRSRDIVYHKELLLDLVSAGLEHLFVEVQSFVKRQLDFYQKYTNPELNITALKVLSEYEIPYIIGLILFDPYVNLQEIDVNLKMLRTLEFHNHIHTDQEPISCLPPLFPIQDTFFYSHLSAEGLWNQTREFKYEFIDQDVMYYYTMLEPWRLKVQRGIEALNRLPAGHSGKDPSTLKSCLINLDVDFMERLCVEIMKPGTSHVAVSNLLGFWEAKLDMLLPIETMNL